VFIFVRTFAIDRSKLLMCILCIVCANEACVVCVQFCVFKLRKSQIVRPSYQISRGGVKAPIKHLEIWLLGFAGECDVP